MKDGIEISPMFLHILSIHVVQKFTEKKISRNVLTLSDHVLFEYKIDFS